MQIYLDLKCLLKREQSHDDNNNNDNNNSNLEKSYTVKKVRHKPSGWAMFKKCSFDVKENIKRIIVEEKIVLKNCVKS